MEKIRIALAQVRSETGRVRENMEKIALFAGQAAAQKVDIICFPEMCIQGYSCTKAHLTAEPVPGESSQAVAGLARETGMVILAGMAEKSGSGKPFVTQLVAFPDGAVQKYRKTHLGKSERSYFTAGEDFPVFAVDRAGFGVQICWDLHFPEVTAIYSLKNAEIIFAPHASPVIAGDRRDIWLKYLPARAYDKAVYIAACNLVGDDGDGQVFCGGALVVDPKGNVVAESFRNREELLVVDLDPALINKIRQKESGSMRYSFYLENRRPELYEELVKKG
ncbi:MAG: nitrilase [Peptococcaceae bacterium]|nr:MAG: nitrilase [Peptococcaceae bacterium]